MSLDTRPTGVDWNSPHTGTVRWGEDKNLLVMFYNRSVRVATSDVGRPIHADQIFVKIQQPGEMLNIIDRPVNEQDKLRFRSQWSAFVHDRTQVPEGTPIDLLFPNHPAVADNLRGMGVYTVEQCADLSAHALDTIGRGAQEYQNRAKKYIEMADKGKSFHVLQKENDELKQQLKIQEQQINSLKNQFELMNTRLVDPVRGSMQPPFISGVDAQVERINGNSPTRELTEKIKKKRTRATTVEDVITNPLGNQNNPNIMDTENQD